jgi:hypothetical protein
MMIWETCRWFFEPDGSLRDIYVRGGGLRSWDVLLKIACDVDAKLSVSGDVHPIPSSSKDFFGTENDATTLLSLRWEGIQLNAHFFAQDDVELDLNPEEISSDARFCSLVSFLSRLATTTGCPVTLTPENCPEQPLIEVDPHTGQAKIVQRYGGETPQLSGVG